MGCVICGRLQEDPRKGPSPWRRGVVLAPSARQVLVCPGCQEADPAWEDVLARCERCDGVSLLVRFGEVSCRSCGPVAARPGPVVPPGPDDRARAQLRADVAAAVDRVLGRTPSG